MWFVGAIDYSNFRGTETS